MKPTVISKEYLALQTEIANKQKSWFDALNKEEVVKKSEISHKHAPIISQVSLHVNKEEYKRFIEELASFLGENNEQIASEIEKLQKLLTEEVLSRWVEEVLSYNQIYFHSFAEENKLAEWLPYFVAENAIRPYLRVVSELYKDELADQETKGSCPCCGEPVRLALLEGKGKKMLICPRCEAKWQQTRLSCVCCGNSDHKKLSYYNVEGDKSAKIEVCDVCNGYIKMIDARKLFKKQAAFLMDLNTLYLDFVAEEKGYGATNDENKVKS